jgi:hypothetical protein
MAITGTSLVGYTAYIYDINDKLLAKTKITEHYRKEMHVEIEDCPGLKHGERCKVLILSLPTPYEFMGTANVHRARPALILLYNGREKEKRQNARYKVDAAVAINDFVRGRQPQGLNMPLMVKLVNISSGGARIRVPHGALSIGDMFEVLLRIGAKEERIWLEAVNTSYVNPETAEYGCKLIAKGQILEGGD